MKFEDVEKQQLATTFGCEVDEVDDVVEKYSNAATEEYVRMVLGQRVFTRGSDVREYRLLLLILHVFDGKVPTEGQISDLFQTTTTQSRSLLRAVMSKFQYELHAAVEATLAGVLEVAQLNDEETMYIVVVDSQVIVEALNRRLGQQSGTLQPLTRVKDTISQYQMSRSAYQNLTGNKPE